MYQLFPPIFNVPEESNFSDSWEVFCCKLLNVENNTSEIVRLISPESGVDLFYQKKKIVYQCKAVESGLTRGFNLTKIKKSYASALKNKYKIGWKKYIVCINIDLTGKQYKNFKEALPGVDILTKSFWVSLCQKHRTLVQDNFRKIIPIPPQTVEQNIKDEFLIPEYSDKLKELFKYKKDCFDLLFYSNTYNSVYRIPVSKKFKVGDLLDILLEIFNLPDTKYFSHGITINFTVDIIHNNKKLDPNKTIEQSGLTENSLVTFLLTIEYSDGSKKARVAAVKCVTEHSLRNMVENSLKQQMELKKALIYYYKEMIKKQFKITDNKLIQ